MHTTAEMPAPDLAADPSDTSAFPPFSLARLLRTVFAPPAGERVAVLIDLKDPHEMKDFAFLADPKLTIQRIAYDTFYLGLRDGVLAELGLTGGEMFAYKITGGSNLDLPDLAVDCRGPRTQPRTRHLSELRPDPLHLDVLGDRAADGVRQAVRFPGGDPARGQPGDPRVGACRWITTR